MQQITLAYGKETIDFTIRGAKSVQVLFPAQADEISDLQTHFRQAVRHPVGGMPLCELVQKQDEITVIISDITRFWSRQDLVLQELVAYLHGEIGVPYENIKVLVATGTHRGQTEEELRKIASDEVFERVQVLCHDCEGELVFLGNTRFHTPVWVNPLVVGRKVICIGATVHHLMSGFGGGRKSILPGVCGKQTVVHNHMMCLDENKPKSSEKIGIGVLQNNPVHLDMAEACRMVNPIFGINIVMNHAGKQHALVCGDMEKAWEKSCELVQNIAGVPVAQKADIVIASCGGYPKDIDLYQGVKTLLNMGQAVKPGGTLLFFARCEEGGGAPDFFDWSKSLTQGTLDADLRAAFTISGYIFYAGCEVIENAQVKMLTELSSDILKQMKIEGFSDVQSLLESTDFLGKDVIVLPQGGNTVAFLQK